MYYILPIIQIRNSNINTKDTQKKYISIITLFRMRNKPVYMVIFLRASISVTVVRKTVIFGHHPTKFLIVLTIYYLYNFFNKDRIQNKDAEIS